MKDDIECLLFVMYLLSCDSRLFLDFLTYPVIKHHLGVAVANKFIGVFWVEGYIRLA